MKAKNLLFSVLSGPQGQGKLSFIGSLFFAFFTIFCNVALLTSSAWLIAKAGLHPALVALSLAIVGVRFFGISRAVSRYIERYISHYMAFQGLYGLRVWFYKQIEPLAPAVLQHYGSGDLLNRIISDIETLQFYYLRVLIPPGAAIMLTVVAIVFLMQFGINFAVLLLIAAIVAGALIPLMVLRHNRQAVDSALFIRSHIKTALVETVDGVMDILTYGKERYIINAIDEQFGKLEQKQIHIHKGNARGDAMFLLVVQLTMVLGAILAILDVRSHYFEGIYIAVLAIGLQSYFEALQPMITMFYHKRESEKATERLLALAKQEPQVIDDLNSRIELGVPSGLRFTHTSFSYNNTVVYNDFNLSIANQEKVAIVGPSGAGKTTLFMILERFYDYKGSVQYNGREIKTLPQEMMRSLCTTLSQDTYIFHATVEENIRLAKPTATMEELEAAINFAGLSELIASLPQGLETMLGAGEIKLSGGQRQRIALARVYLRDAELLLLDEPLEGLDQVSRQNLQEALYRLMEGRTVIYITHHLHGLEKMDRILFMEKGVIQEEGTYDQLMKVNSRFKRYKQLSMEI